MRWTGLEPVPSYGYAPQTYAYANSATTARKGFIIIRTFGGFVNLFLCFLRFRRTSGALLPLSGPEAAFSLRVFSRLSALFTALQRPKILTGSTRNRYSLPSSGLTMQGDTLVLKHMLILSVEILWITSIRYLELKAMFSSFPSKWISI